MNKPSEKPSEAWKDWADSDPAMLEPFYSKWVGLLTSEGLHAKADIATVLALLDQRIHNALQSARAAIPEKEKLPCSCYTEPDWEGCSCGNYDVARSQGYAQGWNDCVDAIRALATKQESGK